MLIGTDINDEVSSIVHILNIAILIKRYSCPIGKIASFGPHSENFAICHLATNAHNFHFH